MDDFNVYLLEPWDDTYPFIEYRKCGRYGSYPDLQKAIDLAKRSIHCIIAKHDMDNDPIYVFPISEWKYHVGVFNSKHEFVPIFEVSTD
jgi:hypothetical protein